MRPSYLDRPVAPATATPVLFAEGHETTAYQGMAAELEAARATIADLEKTLVAVEDDFAAAIARAEEALSKMEADKADAEARARETEAHRVRAEEAAAEAQAALQAKTDELAEAESQIAELTKPKESADESSTKRGNKKGQ